MGKISSAIFDMDGLMFDTESLYFTAEAEIAQKRKREFTLAIQEKMMGQKSLHAIEIMLEELGLDEDPSAVLEERSTIYRSLLKAAAKPMPELFSLLDFLESNGIRKCVATSSAREWVNLLLTRFELERRFEFIISGDEVERGKPDPEIYLKTTERLGLPASSCLVLEDASNGIKAAKAAGCVAVAIPNKFTAGHDFSGADLIVDNLIDQRLLHYFVST